MNNAITANRIVRIDRRRARIALAALCVAVLSSCSTTKKPADAEDVAETTATADAKSGTIASSKYRDPMVSAGARQAQAGNRMPAGGQANTAGLPEGTMPGEASPSISSLATQPTGVRAGSFSIFSSPTAPAPLPTQMSDGTPAPAGEATGSAPPSGHLNAATKSVFSAQPANCGADANGVALRC